MVNFIKYCQAELARNAALVMDDTTRQILREAANVISEHGWVQGHLRTGEGVCAMGAIRGAVEDRRGWNYSYTVKVHNALLTHLLNSGRLNRFEPEPQDGGLPLHPIALWNDATERTAEDVILALKRAGEL